MKNLISKEVIEQLKLTDKDFESLENGVMNGLVLFLANDNIVFSSHYDGLVLANLSFNKQLDYTDKKTVPALRKLSKSLDKKMKELMKGRSEVEKNMQKLQYGKVVVTIDDKEETILVPFGSISKKGEDFITFHDGVTLEDVKFLDK